MTKIHEDWINSTPGDCGRFSEKCVNIEHLTSNHTKALYLELEKMKKKEKVLTAICLVFVFSLDVGRSMLDVHLFYTYEPLWGTALCAPFVLTPY